MSPQERSRRGNWPQEVPLLRTPPKAASFKCTHILSTLGESFCCLVRGNKLLFPHRFFCFLQISLKLTHIQLYNRKVGRKFLFTCIFCFTTANSSTCLTVQSSSLGQQFNPYISLVSAAFVFLPVCVDQINIKYSFSQLLLKCVTEILLNSLPLQTVCRAPCR